MAGFVANSPAPLRFVIYKFKIIRIFENGRYWGFMDTFLIYDILIVTLEGRLLVKEVSSI